jgi:hypothetical protein
MEVHYSDLLFSYLAMKDPNFTITESPGGIKVVEWVYTDDKMFVGIFSADNELIAYHFE